MSSQLDAAGAQRNSLHAPIYQKYHNLPLAQWVELLCQTAQQPVVEGLRFPGFPDPDLQRSMVGIDGEGALRQVIGLYLLVHQHCAERGPRFTHQTRVLDFGCGFGRLLRFFMKDAAPGNLVGTDVDDGFISICRELFQGGTFDINKPFPPLSYADASFDIIYAYSVFSHLAEDAHRQWLKEFRRILRPGGLAFLTVRQKPFLEHCAFLRTLPEIGAYDKVISDFFGDREVMMSRYMAGEFLYSPSGGGDMRTSDFYGDAVISTQYIKENWSEHFTVLDVMDDPNRLEQSVAVLAHPERPSLLAHPERPSLLSRILGKVLPA